MNLRRTTLTLAALVTFAGLAPGRALAGDQGPAYQLSFNVDTPILLFGGALASSYLLMSEASPPACAPRCDASKVNAFDRPFAGLYSRPWQTVGDIATASTLVLVPLSVILDEGPRHGLQDALVVGEAVLMTSGTEAIVNYAVKRPRPRVYGDTAPLDERNDGNAGRSFFSGHAGNCMAATVAATLALRRLGHVKLGWVIFGAGLAGTSLVAVARVGAGSHFPSDVLAGMAVGAAFGIAIPALHAANVQVAPLTTAQSRGVALTVVF